MRLIWKAGVGTDDSDLLKSELTHFCWISISSGEETDVLHTLLKDEHTKHNISEDSCTLFLRSWFCSPLGSLAVYGRLQLLLEDGPSLSLSFSLSPNQEKGMHVGMAVIDSAGDKFPPDSSSNSADPLIIPEIGTLNVCWELAMKATNLEEQTWW